MTDLKGRSFLLVGIVLVAVNLRSSLAAVGPLVTDIRTDLGLGDAAFGLLTTLPLLAFGLVSTFTPRVTRRLGVERAVVVALGLIVVGTLARLAPSVVLLFAGTAVLGVGIALGNVLLPALTKRGFPDQMGRVTSLYSSAMGLGASVAAGVSVPLAFAIGWRGSLGAWAVPALVAFVAWLMYVPRQRPVRPRRRPDPASRPLVRSLRAWQVALFMGLQSLTFYVLLAWLPDLLQDRQFDPTSAGWLLALSQATSVLGTALVPLWAGRVRDQRRIVGWLGLLEAVALAGLLAPGLAPFVGVWVGLIGFVLGGTFGLALLFLVLRSRDAEGAGQLSGMAQSIGYLIAAAGPVVFGLIHDLTGEWSAPLSFLLLVLVGKVAVGWQAGREGLVDPEARRDRP